MVHTFELSKMISKEMFDTVINSLKMRRYRGCWATKDYADRGFPLIHLYKIKQKKASAYSGDSHYYMIALSVNLNKMLGGDGHSASNILAFSSDIVRVIYRNIFEFAPCLEIHPEWCLDFSFQEW